MFRGLDFRVFGFRRERGWGAGGLGFRGLFVVVLVVHVGIFEEKSQRAYRFRVRPYITR